MQYSAINIQGNILSSEILEKIRTEDIRYQTQADFGLDKNTTIRDEIGIAWAAARAHWSAFQLRRERLKENDTGTSETRSSWMIPFLRELGYELEKSNAEVINGKTYAISHRAANRDTLPVHIVGINQSLDKRASVGGTRLSPHALIQEYLNNHEHLYALVTNGQFLRLLRDATRLSRLSYLEFDLERIMEEELFAEFALLYRLLHITRMPEKQDEGDESVIEFYHQEALDSGSRIREKLSQAVEQSLKELANGLLKHPQNDTLRDEVLQGNMKPNTFYLYLLRLVYRILFLLVIEERHLIYPEKRDEATNKKRSIYYRFYSINRLTRLAEKQIYVDPRKTDLWKSLLVTFKLFENNFYGEKLDIKPLGSGLFAPDALGNLANQSLSNGTLLKVLNLLVTFENEQKQRVRVNYADLDVEEFGSVYEGLLEYDPAINEIDGQPQFSFVKGESRSSSGSHYTPEELVKPLIKHSLDYIIEERLKEPHKYISTQAQIGKRIFSPSGEMSRSDRGVSSNEHEKRLAQEAALLSITVCDVAAGSGHILLSAARRIALALARVRTNEDQPTPPAMRQATRDVIRNCIYGVDLNPLAVELCKVALWLEAHNPGEPLNFLDHRIKCGNSIVGLAHKEELKNGIADEAFKSLPSDEKEIAATYRNKNKAERKLADQTTLNFDGVVEEPLSGILEKLEQVNSMPETTPQEIEAKQHAYNNLVSGPRWWKLKTLADMQVAQFFIPKTTVNNDRLVTDIPYREYLNGQKSLQDQASALATAKSQQKRFFHWFLEFPEIFEKGGFDCMVGNPPYLGGKRISGYYGDDFLNFIKSTYIPSDGGLDLVTYFFRRIFSIMKFHGFLSLISTKTIYQGDSRIGGLEFILNKGGSINFAIRLMTWPGRANVEVTLITISKNRSFDNNYLNNKRVGFITSRLDSEQESSKNPYVLKFNQEKSFIGSVVNGTGFIINENQDHNFERDIIYPYLSGNDINNELNQKASRLIINFKDWEHDFCKKEFPKAYEWVKNNVKPHRDTLKRESYKKLWWQYAEKCTDLYSQIRKFSHVLVIPRVSKYLNVAVVDREQVFMDKVVVLNLDPALNFGLIQNSFFNHWAWKYSSTLGSSTINFRPTEAFQTFPFKIGDNLLFKRINKKYVSYRKSLMLDIQYGLTKTYNAFHSSEINLNVHFRDIERKTKKEIEKKYGKETWNLWNHLQKTEGTCTWEEAVEGIEELRRLHVEMDNAVLEAYDWHKDSEKWGKAIELKHDFYEVDYLPENDRVRFTIQPEARKEVLKRLLLLNHERYEEEIKQGLHKKKDVEKFYEQKGQPVPTDVVFSDRKSGAKKKSTNQRKKVAPKVYGQHNLFGEAAEPEPKKKDTKNELVIDSSLRKIEWHHSLKNFKVVITNSSGHEFRYHVLPEAQRGKFTKDYKQIKPNSPMAENIIGKQERDTFEFGGQVYRIERIEI